MESGVKAVLLVPLCLVLAAAGACAGEAPLPPGKPAGVHPAAMNASTTEIAVGVAIAGAIAVILAASSSSSSPVTAG
jgi:hypothetical protein